VDPELSSPGHVTNALARLKQKSLLQAIGVDLPVLWRGENFNRRLLSGLSSLPLVIVGGTRQIENRFNLSSCKRFPQGGQIFSCSLFALI
jgi:hypothetical protein